MKGYTNEPVQRDLFPCFFDCRPRPVCLGGDGEGGEVMGLFSFIGCLFSETARYNRDLYRTGRADKNKVVYTSIRPDLGEDETTASGYVEKSRPDNKYDYSLDWDDSERP